MLIWTNIHENFWFFSCVRDFFDRVGDPARIALQKKITTRKMPIAIRKIRIAIGIYRVAIRKPNCLKNCAFFKYFLIFLNFIQIFVFFLNVNFIYLAWNSRVFHHSTGFKRTSMSNFNNLDSRLNIFICWNFLLVNSHKAFTVMGHRSPKMHLKLYLLMINWEFSCTNKILNGLIDNIYFLRNFLFAKIYPFKFFSPNRDTFEKFKRFFFIYNLSISFKKIRMIKCLLIFVKN